MSEKLTFEIIKKEMEKGPVFLRTENRVREAIAIRSYNDKEYIITWNPSNGSANYWRKWEIEDWQIVRPEKKKVKYWPAVLKHHNGTASITAALFRTDDEAKEEFTSAIRLATEYPAIEIEEE